MCMMAHGGLGGYCVGPHWQENVQAIGFRSRTRSCSEICTTPIWVEPLLADCASSLGA